MSDKSKFVPFNKPSFTGNELEYARQAIEGQWISGNGRFSQICQSRLEELLGSPKVLLTTSCTDALEMAAMLLCIEPGDEVIVPSFTFVSTANALVVHGAKPVFVDVREDTLNLDETLLAEAITSRTRAIVPVHYAGVSCNMEAITNIAAQAGISVVEDAAQGIGATYNGQALGAIGRLGALSFHETKNIHCGEGGALCINDPTLIERAEILWQKGTDRNRFNRKEVDKYTWQDLGSSFLPSDLLAAYLLAQLEKIEPITQARLALFDRYAKAFEKLETQTSTRLPHPERQPLAVHNGHIYYLLLESEDHRNRMIDHLRQAQVASVFHYLPLHKSPMGRRLGGDNADCPVTESVCGRLLRLPLFYGMDGAQQDQVIEAVYSYFGMSSEHPTLRALSFVGSSQGR